MSGNGAPQSIRELSKEELVQWVIEGFRRTLVHYGYWFKEVENRVGFEDACVIENEAGDRLLGTVLKRLSAIFDIPLEGGLPGSLRDMGREELLVLMEENSKNWLACDGLWFLGVESRYGMESAKHCNDTCWSRFAPYEALRIKTRLGMPASPGLEGLKTAFGFRMYAMINKQSIEQVDSNSFIFRMNECRVQSTRKAKGLPDYPCKSAGIVEFPTFARSIDERIRTECVGCPPDEHPEEWFCAWKFIMDDR
jgi:hypothetical protein